MRELARSGPSPLSLAASLLFAATRSAADEPAPNEGTDEPIEEMIVTGTRIPLPALEAVAPVTTLTRRDIERSGATSIAEVIDTLPMVANAPLHPYDTTGVGGEPTMGGSIGDGSARVDLRGLSPERTVVLLNGRRFPNGGIGADGSVDLNMIPLSMIERVEVLPSGASTVYGADAVGGVVNIITRKHYRGMELAASRRISAAGDGEVITGQASAFLGSWSLGLDYTDEEGVTLDRRAYSALPLMIVDNKGTLGPATSNAVSDSRFEVPAGNALGLAPGTYTRVEGATGQTAADYRSYTREADGFNAAPYNYLQMPNRRKALWLLGRQPLGDRMTFLMEGLLERNESAQTLAPEPYYAGRRSPAPELADGSLGVPADNYYNPFKVDLGWFFGSSPVAVARRFVEAGDRSVHEDSDMWRVLLGLEGGLGSWTWAINVSASRSDAKTVETNFFAQPRFLDAVGPSGLDAAGHVVCGKPDPATGLVAESKIIRGCVPLNLFGGAGSVTQAQLDYMIPRPLVTRGTNDQQTAQLVFNGPGGHVFSRDLQWVAGVDYRAESGSRIQDPLTLLWFNGVITDPVPDSHYDAVEPFAEVHVPLLHDRRWARDMTLSFSTRWSDFSSFGETMPWQGGLTWQPLEQLLFRGNYSQVFRAPTLAELNDPPILSDEQASDPCGNDPTAAQRANCAANGVPGGAYVQIDQDFVVISGGNADLGPETGYSTGIGFTWNPLWTNGLSFTVNLNRTLLSGSVGQPQVFDVLNECAERGSPIVCNAITRYPDGSIKQVATFNQNFGLFETRALDLTFDWHTTARFGELTSRLLGSWLERLSEQPFPGGTILHRAGTFDVGALPHWRASGSLDWKSGPWSAGYAVEYTGHYTELVEAFLPFDVVFDAYRRQVDAVMYHDLSAGYEFASGVRVRAAVNNLFDEDPPFVNSGSISNTDSDTYRLLGRMYFLELRYSFE